MSGVAIEAIAGLHERVIRCADEIPHTGSALGQDNDFSAIEQAYQASPTSVTVIDDFLSPDALAQLREFCLNSTIFFGHNATGYVTSYMADGFVSPLLYRVAEELQDAMPSVLGGRHLHNMWVYRHRNEGAGGSMPTPMMLRSLSTSGLPRTRPAETPSTVAWWFTPRSSRSIGTGTTSTCARTHPT